MKPKNDGDAGDAPIDEAEAKGELALVAGLMAAFARIQAQNQGPSPARERARGRPVDHASAASLGNVKTAGDAGRPDGFAAKSAAANIKYGRVS